MCFHHPPLPKHFTRIPCTFIRNPSYFRYEVDRRLRKLTAPASIDATVYLAYIHAATADPIAEPLTGVTGNEMAGPSYR